MIRRFLTALEQRSISFAIIGQSTSAEAYVGDAGYTTFQELKDLCEVNDTSLTAHQRVINRFGTSKKPGSFTIEVEKAKTLRGILDTVTGIHDVMRYSTCLLTRSTCMPCVAFAPFERGTRKLCGSVWLELRATILFGSST